MNMMLKFSQLNGLISDLFKGIGSFFTNIISVVFGVFLVRIYHMLVIPVFLLMDGIQLLFRKFAGLDTYKINGTAQSGDIVLTLINNQTVQNVFWSLVILAVVLLIITTIVALIKAQTQAADDKNKQSNSKIFASAVKALINFFMVPVVAILGIFMGNALLKSLDKATSGGSQTISSLVFTTCAYEANRARLSTTFAEDLAVNHLNDMGVLKGTTENIADVVDAAFKNSTTFDAKGFDLSGLGGNLFSDSIGDYLFVVTMTVYSGGTAYIPRTCFSVYDMWQVFYYYDLVSFNYLFFLIAGIFVCYVLFTTSIGLIKRMFKLTMLLVVSPPIAALMPLDNGGALGRWRKHFISSTLSAYATVVALNLTMMLLGPISQIDFFYVSSGSSIVDSVVNYKLTGVNNVAQLLILCGALYFFKDMVKVLSELIGAENAYEDGGKATQELANKVAQGAMAAAGFGGAYSAQRAAKNLLNSGKKNLAGAESAVNNAQKELDAAYESGDKGKIEAAKLNLQAAKDNRARVEESKKNSDAAAQQYTDLANSRLRSARNSFSSLASGGISDKVNKTIADSRKASGIKEAEAKFATSNASDIYGKEVGVVDKYGPMSVKAVRGMYRGAKAVVKNSGKIARAAVGSVKLSSKTMATGSPTDISRAVDAVGVKPKIKSYEVNTNETTTKRNDENNSVGNHTVDSNKSSTTPINKKLVDKKDKKSKKNKKKK